MTVAPTTRPHIARVHIALADISPPIWRRIEIGLAATLQDLHDAIQAVMPWEDCHLFEFEAGDAIYGVPDPEMEPEPTVCDVAETRLADLTAAGVRQFTYRYDFGDGWEHLITIETTEEAKPKTLYPRYLEGARRAPPEDIGGVDGFADFLKILAKGPKAAREEALDWVGGEYDPAEVDEDEIAANLEEIAQPVKKGR